MYLIKPGRWWEYVFRASKCHVSFLSLQSCSPRSCLFKQKPWMEAANQIAERQRSARSSAPHRHHAHQTAEGQGGRDLWIMTTLFLAQLLNQLPSGFQEPEPRMAQNLTLNQRTSANSAGSIIPINTVKCISQICLFFSFNYTHILEIWP